MAKPVLEFPAKKIIPAQDLAAIKVDAVDRGYPKVNGKQAIGRAVISQPVRDPDTKQVIGYKTLTTYKLEDDTEITINENGDTV